MRMLIEPNWTRLQIGDLPIGGAAFAGSFLQASMAASEPASFPSVGAADREGVVLWPVTLWGPLFSKGLLCEN